MTEDTETTKVVEEASLFEDEQTKLVRPSDDVVTTVAAVTDHVSEPPTLRKFFGIPETPSEDGGECWQALQKTLAKETQSIKWPTAMPDLVSKIGELLDIRIHDMFLTAWKKVEAVRQALEESKQSPAKAIYLDLSDHNIDYETKPFIDVKIKRASVKKLTLTVAVNLNVKGFSLKVQNGQIRELQTGKCEGEGTIKYEKLTVAQKKLEPIKFPATIAIPDLIEIPETSETPAAATPVAPNELRSEDELERIEL
jgi:hypothetical protein